MQLSEWRASAPSREAVGTKVLSLLGDVLVMFKAGRDPECWVVWGDEPAVRWSILVPIPAGLVIGHIRVNVPHQGPRVAAKLVRWRRVEHGEFTVETTDNGHRLISGSVERMVLHGVDAQADAIAAFLVSMYDAEDGRAPAPDPTSRLRRVAATSRPRPARSTRPSGSQG